MTDSDQRFPTLFIPHGGGPCFFMEWTTGPPDTWERMGNWLRGLSASLGARPQALVVISAHWEAPEVTSNASAAPALIYDYYGFPEHTYALEYPAPGAPALSARIGQLLGAAGIAWREDPAHGFDHGVFIPLKLVYPDADIPIVQLSLREGLDPGEHLQIGAALAPLRGEGVLIIGSGLSFHNLRVLMSRGATNANADSDAFDAWLGETCEADPEVRAAGLRTWESAPSARRAHPREEHLLPLMVAAGAAGADRGRRIFTDRVLGATVSGYQFGAALNAN